MSCVLQGVEEWKRPSRQPRIARWKATPDGFTSNWGDLVSGGRVPPECPRLEGRRGNSSNCKVKLTPTVIVSLCALSPFISSLILFRKNKDMTTSLTLRPSAVHLQALLPLRTCRFIHHCWLRGSPAALHKRIKRKEVLTVKYRFYP